MDVMASQIISFTIVYSTIHSGADQRKHQSSVSQAFVRGIHQWPVNSPHKWPVGAENVFIWWHHHGSVPVAPGNLLYLLLSMWCSIHWTDYPITQSSCVPVTGNLVTDVLVQSSMRCQMVSTTVQSEDIQYPFRKDWMWKQMVYSSLLVMYTLSSPVWYDSYKLNFVHQRVVWG